QEVAPDQNVGFSSRSKCKSLGLGARHCGFLEHGQRLSQSCKLLVNFGEVADQDFLLLARACLRGNVENGGNFIGGFLACHWFEGVFPKPLVRRQMILLISSNGSLDLSFLPYVCGPGLRVDGVRTRKRSGNTHLAVAIEKREQLVKLPLGERVVLMVMAL